MALRAKRHASSSTNSFSSAAAGAVVNRRARAMQDVEQQRLQHERKLLEPLEVEALDALKRQRVFDVVEERRRTGPPWTQRCRCWPSGPRQQVGEREEPALRRIEGVEILDGLVEIAVVRSACSWYCPLDSQQHAHEREQEVQIALGVGSRQNGLMVKAAMRQAHPPDAAAEQRRQRVVAAAEIEDDRDGVVLLRVRQQEVQQERLAATPSRPGPATWPDVVVMQVPEVRRLVLGLEDRQALAAAEVRARPRARVQREQEAQIRDVRVQQRQAAQIVGAVAGHDREPGIQEVVTLLVEVLRRARQRPSRTRRRVRSRRRGSWSYGDDRQRAGAEEVAVDLHLGEALAELVDGGRRGVVDEHLLGLRLRTEVVDQRDPLVEEVTAPCVQVAAHRARSTAAAIPDRR